jgi:hypothetical protein
LLQFVKPLHSRNTNTLFHSFVNRRPSTVDRLFFISN